MNKSKNRYPKMDSNGNKYWKNKNRQFHRINGPAYESIDGTRMWYIDGQRHRLDGPTFEYNDGYKVWYLNDKNISFITHFIFLMYKTI